MDLNELLHAHQVQVMKAAESGDVTVRQSHFDKVALYAERIRGLRDIFDPRNPASLPGRETIMFGTDAGEPPANPLGGAVNRWESEGGALDPLQIPLPEGVSSKMTFQFFVGPYVYSDLSLALAEHARQARALNEQVREPRSFV